MMKQKWSQQICVLREFITVYYLSFYKTALWNIVQRPEIENWVSANSYVFLMPRLCVVELVTIKGSFLSFSLFIFRFMLFSFSLSLSLSFFSLCNHLLIPLASSRAFNFMRTTSEDNIQFWFWSIFNLVLAKFLLYNLNNDFRY